MLHHQWSTEVGKLRVAPAMAPSREPRMDCLAAWQPHCDSRNGKDIWVQTPPVEPVDWLETLVLREEFRSGNLRAMRSNLLCPRRVVAGVLRSVRLTADRVEEQRRRCDHRCPIPLRNGRWLKSDRYAPKPTRSFENDGNARRNQALALNRAALACTRNRRTRLPECAASRAVLGTAVSAEDVPGVVAMAQPKPASFTKGLRQSTHSRGRR
jgi:hypothetical protein